MRLLKRRFITSLLCLTPVFAFAGSCEDITEQIKHDTAKYGNQIASQHLPWMCLSWLQQEMGKRTAKKIADNQLSYTWTCATDSDSELTVKTDNNGKLTQIDGQYSSERGAGVFSAAVNSNCKTSKTTVTVSATATIKRPDADTTPNTIACDATAEQIYDVAMMSQARPYNHAPFAWEDKNWLKKTYGKPEIHTAATHTFYTWHCENDAMTTISYSEPLPGHEIQLTTICKGSHCYLATVNRDNNLIKGNLKSIEPKPI